MTKSTEVAEYDGAGNLLRRFVPGPSLNDYIAMESASGVKTFFHTDKMGSVVAMSDTAGNRVEGPYVYDPFGACWDGAVPCKTGVPFRFTGQRRDPEMMVMYFHGRNYFPALGRFMQTDPIGYKDDLDLYTYVGNDPTDATDPTGSEVDQYGFGITISVFGVGHGSVQAGTQYDSQGRASHYVQYGTSFTAAKPAPGALLPRAVAVTGGAVVSHSDKANSVNDMRGTFHSTTVQIGPVVGEHYSGNGQGGQPVSGNSVTMGQGTGFGVTKGQTTTFSTDPQSAAHNQTEDGLIAAGVAANVAGLGAVGGAMLGVAARMIGNDVKQTTDPPEQRLHSK